MRSLKTAIAGIFAMMMCVATPSNAHVPPECAPLYIKAGEDMQKLIQKGQETSDMAMDGLDPDWQRRYPTADTSNSPT